MVVAGRIADGCSGRSRHPRCSQGKLLADRRCQPQRQGLVRGDLCAADHRAARGVGTDALHQPSGSQHDAELRPRKAQRRVRRSNAVLAHRKQVRPGAPRPPLRQRHGAQRGVPEQRQQGLDTDKAQQQLAIGRAVKIRKVEPGAKMLSGTTQHQRMDRLVRDGCAGRFYQCLYQVGAQRIADLRPIERQRQHAVVTAGFKNTHETARARTAADRSQRLGNSVLS